MKKKTKKPAPPVTYVPLEMERAVRDANKLVRKTNIERRNALSAGVITLDQFREERPFGIVNGNIVRVVPKDDAEEANP